METKGEEDIACTGNGTRCKIGPQRGQAFLSTLLTLSALVVLVSSRETPALLLSFSFIPYSKLLPQGLAKKKPRWPPPSHMSLDKRPQSTIVLMNSLAALDSASAIFIFTLGGEERTRAASQLTTAASSCIIFLPVLLISEQTNEAIYWDTLFFLGTCLENSYVIKSASEIILIIDVPRAYLLKWKFQVLVSF